MLHKFTESDGYHMNFNELAAKRTCSRGYLSKSVPNELILQLLKAAQSAPSAGNIQPWHFYIITDNTFIKSMYKTVYSSPWIYSAPVLIAVCTDEKLCGHRYGNRGESLYCLQDAAAAIQNILLCAEDLDLGACWIGDFNENNCISALNLPKNHRPVALITIGYTENRSKKPRRKPLSEVVTFIGHNDEN